MPNRSDQDQSYTKSDATRRFDAALRGAFAPSPVKAKPKQETKPKKKPSKASS